MDHAITLDLRDPGHSVLIKWHRTANKMLGPSPSTISRLGEEAQGYKGALISLIFLGMLLGQPALLYGLVRR